MDASEAIDYIINNQIEGDIVECGVEQGRSIIRFIHQLQKYNHFRKFWLFDTFQGLTKPSVFDYTIDNEIEPHYRMNNLEVQAIWNQNKIPNTDVNLWCFYPLDQLQQRLCNETNGYPQELLHYVVGNVLDTLQDQKNIPSKIALLRLDTDFYDSSKFELERLYDSVVEGGLIILDDYYFWNGQRAATNEFLKEKGISESVIQKSSYGSGSFIKH